MEREHKDNRIIAVIGGGAAGLMAAAAAGLKALEAAAAGHAGCRVLLLERREELGRKIYATGNGRCNLTNYAMSDDYYNVDIMDRLQEQEFDHEALIAYFKDLGVYTHDRNGYVYPRTDQAATIAEALIRQIRLLEASGIVEVHCKTRVTDITMSDRKDSRPFCIFTTTQDTYAADRVILAVGGMVAKAYGCTGDGYQIAKELGHRRSKISPALVPIYVADPYLKIAAGVRCAARVTALVDGEEVAADTGELQITDSGFSGIPVFQISRWLSQALSRHQTEIAVDFLPEFTEAELEAEITRRAKDPSLVYVRDMTSGLVHSKIGAYLARTLALADEKKLANLSDRDQMMRDLIHQLKHRSYTVTGTADWDKAQVTAGGIPLDEIDVTFQSTKTQGLYLAGELLDVDGMCGGYNLTWAMCSGHLAGLHAAMDT